MLAIQRAWDYLTLRAPEILNANTPRVQSNNGHGNIHMNKGAYDASFTLLACAAETVSEGQCMHPELAENALDVLRQTFRGTSAMIVRSVSIVTCLLVLFV